MVIWPAMVMTCMTIMVVMILVAVMFIPGESAVYGAALVNDYG